MKPLRRAALRTALPWLCLLAAAHPADAVTPATQQAALARAVWQQHLGTALPLQLAFSEESGRVVPLAHYFSPGRPVALVLMYLSCSRLCPLTLSLTQQAFDRAGLVPGRDFELLAVSIDPYDGVAAAARRKLALAPQGAWQRGLHLLTAAPADRASLTPASARLAAAAGFGYLRDAADSQYAHPAGWVLLDPRGHVSRYFFGLQYDPRALREAVHQASVQAPPTWTQPLRLLCACLTVLTGRYDGRVLDGLRLLCVALMALGGLWLWRSLVGASREGRT